MLAQEIRDYEKTNENERTLAQRRFHVTAHVIPLQIPPCSHPITTRTPVSQANDVFNPFQWSCNTPNYFKLHSYVRQSPKNATWSL